MEGRRGKSTTGIALESRLEPVVVGVRLLILAAVEVRFLIAMLKAFFYEIDIVLSEKEQSRYFICGYVPLCSLRRVLLRALMLWGLLHAFSRRACVLRPLLILAIFCFSR